MRINNISKFKKSELYHCYSTNQYKYIILNGIEPLRYRLDNKTNQVFAIFVITNELSTLLNEWTDAGKRGEHLVE